MGNSSSSLSTVAGGELEGEHFLRITQPTRKQSVIELSKSKEVSATNPSKGLSKVEVIYKARIIKCLSCEILWNNFLSGPVNSFALTFAETSALLLESLKCGNGNVSSGEFNISNPSDAQAAIDSYLELIKEANGTTSPNVVDFMSLCSSVLLLSSAPIETKVDKLFEWITIGEGNDYFVFEDLFVALNSFERG
jgi:hypothetical protein